MRRLSSESGRSRRRQAPIRHPGGPACPPRAPDAWPGRASTCGKGTPWPRCRRRLCRLQSSICRHAPARPRSSATARRPRPRRCRRRGGAPSGSLRSGDPGALHDGDDAPVARGARPGPERLAGAPGAHPAQPVDELEGAQRLGRQRDLAPVLGPALERADPDRRRVQIDVDGPERQDLGKPGAGMSEG